MQEFMRLFRFEKAVISSFAMTLLLGVCGMLCGCGAPQAGQVAKLPMSSKLILRDVTVVDTHDGSLSPHMDIMMDRGKIVTIAPTGISASSSRDDLKAMKDKVRASEADVHH
jgi:hypothetical protein